MLKKLGFAGVLLAVSAVGPLTAVAQDRNYNNHNQTQRASQAQHSFQMNNSRGSRYNSQNFRGGRELARNTFVNRHDVVNRYDVVDRGDRYAKLRFYNGHNHGPMPYRNVDRDDFCRR